MQQLEAEVVICGAGSAGIAAAYYLAKQGVSNIILVDKHAPMSQTSAKTGENYRNWWPSEVMVQFVNRSIDLMEDIAQLTDNAINLVRRGYLYVSCKNVLGMLEPYQNLPVGDIRIHDAASSNYLNSKETMIGADVLTDKSLIQKHFPHLSTDVQTAIDVRRAGSLSAQQLGAYQLAKAKEQGLLELHGEVVAVLQDGVGVSGVRVEGDEAWLINTRCFVNAAGAFVNQVAQLLELELPSKTVFQQKIAFRDIHNIVPRTAPFTIFMDEQKLNWSDEDRALLSEDPDYRWLFEDFPAGLHIKPEGGDGGSLVKMGWAFNSTDEPPQWQRDVSQTFPDVVLLGATRFIPELSCYVGKLPQPVMHYGGYYCKTEENLPLIGKMVVEGAFVIGALSGFGTMACCAAGELLATWLTGNTLPPYADALSLSRYENPALMVELNTSLQGEL